MKIYKHYKVDVNILTPLFIGSDKEYASVELYLDVARRKLFCIDIKKLAGDLVGKTKRLTDVLLADNTRIVLDPNKVKNILGRDIQEYLSVLENWEVDEAALQTNRKIPVTFKTFIKDGNGDHFIPGSSLKGAFHNLFRFYEGVKSKNYKDEEIGKIFGFSDFNFVKKEVRVIEIRRENRLPQFVEAVISGRAEGELRFYQGFVDLDFKIKDFKRWGEEYLQEVEEYGSEKTKMKLKKIREFLNKWKINNYDVVLPLGLGKGYDFSIGGKKSKYEFVKENIEKGGRLSPQLNRNKRVKELIKNFKFQKSMSAEDLIEKIKAIFPSTSWEYKGIPLGWVSLKFTEK